MRLLIVGHSHINALSRAYEENGEQADGVRIDFLNFREEKYWKGSVPPRTPEMSKLDALLPDFSSLANAADIVVFCINGNEHNNVGMFEFPSRNFGDAEILVKRNAAENYKAWLKRLLPCFEKPAVFLPPPPPFESEEFILGTGKIEKIGKGVLKVRRAQERLALWMLQCRVIEELGLEFGLEVIRLPESVFSPSGFLATDCPSNATHGNAKYGERVLQALIERLSSTAFDKTLQKRSLDKRKHPYRALPDYCFWKQSISDIAAETVDPVVNPPFKINANDKVATAGSCFAQHISRHLRAGGFNYLVVEPSSESSDGKDEGPKHDFSAQYGNVYTSRQLLQLFDRAHGYFRPLEPVWHLGGDRFCDPFRPTIRPGGYPTREAVIDAARRHLAAVRKMFRQLDVFVFTLGLTECWASRLDGAVYPIAPGVAGGEFDPEKHEFVNLGVREVVSDMQAFIRKLRHVNQNAKIILTVSPVPLAATYENRHVLVSTTYSKSVLRVAVEELITANEGIYYFPSYEIITGGHAVGGYYESDRRGVSSSGVDHVMRIFMSRLTEIGDPRKPMHIEAIEEMIEEVGEVLCEEEMLNRQ